MSEPRWIAPAAGGAYLLPHEWDAIAPPLPPGGNYPTADLRDEEVEIDKLLDEARSSDERAERLEEDAAEERDGIEEALDEAREVVEERVRPKDEDAAERLLKKIDGWRR